MMGQMDVEKYTVTILGAQPEIFNSCTDVVSNENELSFDDRNGKRHEFFGVSYHVAQE